ncbi:MAG: aminodeoxychorismate synthase component I [Haliangiales bacterium]
MSADKPILIVDNYDSFTFNLFQMLAALCPVEPVVVPNDCDQRLDIGDFDRVVLSPGPGTPERPGDFGICRGFLQQAQIPVLGVCLGHQGIGVEFGAKVVRAPRPMHGRKSRIHHGGDPLFAGVPDWFEAVRYHSLMLQWPLPSCLQAIAWTDDELIMGVRHRARPFWGIQFHPESICTEHGARLLTNFCQLGQASSAASAASGSVAAVAAGDEPRRLSARPASQPRIVPRQAAQTPALTVASRELPTLYSPEAAFVQLFSDKPGSFWLDSSLVVDGLSRFSFIGAPDGPLSHEVRYDVSQRSVRVVRGERETAVPGSIFDYLSAALAASAADGDGLPFDFCGGYVGYLGYELKGDTGGTRRHQSPHDDARLFFIDRFIGFDHVANKTYLVVVHDRETRAAQLRWLDDMASALDTLSALAPPTLGSSRAPITVNMAREPAGYLRDIAHCQAAIAAGETYEVCLTNQMTVERAVSPLALYRVLRARNPAPYAAFLNAGDCAVVCSSPERFLRIDRDGWAESRPIKGTSPRSADPAEDRRLAEALAASEKDNAENLMIVDLVRNDLGRTCEIGTVHVPKLSQVESYATLHQLVSTVRGRVRADRGAIAAVRAAFPGGSMTGAPKIRTMALIDHLEARARGIYSGSIGYISLNQAVDLNIVIRTAVVTDERITLGVGGAVVALSDPVQEYQEMLLKARAPLYALSELIHGQVSPARLVLGGDADPEPARAQPGISART